MNETWENRNLQKGMKNGRNFVQKKRIWKIKIPKNSENLIKKNALEKSKNASIYRVKNEYLAHSVLRNLYEIFDQDIDIWEVVAILLPRYEALTTFSSLLRTLGG